MGKKVNLTYDVETGEVSVDASTAEFAIPTTMTFADTLVAEDVEEAALTTTGQACPGCGAGNSMNAGNCSTCGASMSGDGAAKPTAAGAPNAPDDNDGDEGNGDDDNEARGVSSDHQGYATDLARKLTAALRKLDADGEPVQPVIVEVPAEKLGEIVAMTFSDEELDNMAASGDEEFAKKRPGSMPDGSYPVNNAGDLAKAIHAVGRGKNNSHNAIRAHIIARAKALGLSKMIPDNWNPDGSLKASAEGDTLALGDEEGMPAVPAVQPVEAAPVAIDPTNPGRFRAVLAMEDERTADDRIIEPGAVKWRDTPLPLMLMTKTAEGHDGAEVCGVIESIARDGNAIVAIGRFDNGPTGIEAARLVANQVLTGVSIDAGDVTGDLVVEAEDDNGMPTKVLRKMTSLTIGAATICPFQAIESAKIEYVAPDATFEAETTIEEEMAELEEIVAAAPISFPQAMFDDPQLEAPTPIRVDADGRVYGHAALWGTNHISFPGAQVTPPKSRTNYSHFLTGSLPLQEGGYAPVGTIALATNHADHALSARDAAAYYDHTGTGVAYVNVGEDAHGIWVAGVLKPGITDESATELCASSLSGDWRRIGGGLELVALLAVNTPGFPVAHTRNGEQTALVAAGYGVARRKQHLAAEIDARNEATAARIAQLEGELSKLNSLVAPIVRERVAARFAE